MGRARAKSFKKGAVTFLTNVSTVLKTTTRLRELLKTRKIIVAPGAYDAENARIIEKVGFDVVNISGAAVCTSMGLQDVGLVSRTEVTSRIRHIADAVRIPVLADVDVGFGNAIHVTRTVRELIHAGAAAMKMEDQTSYKRCGHLAGKVVIPLEEAVGKYRAAADVRDEYDKDFVIIARTDSRGAVGGSLEEAIERGNAYADAGADVIHADAIPSEEELVRFVKEVHAPVAYNNSGISPRIEIDRLQEIGVKLMLSGSWPSRAARFYVWDLASAFKTRGIIVRKEWEEQTKTHPIADLHAWRRMGDIMELEEKYLPKEEVELRGAKSTVGLDIRRKNGKELPTGMI